VELVNVITVKGNENNSGNLDCMCWLEALAQILKHREALRPFQASLPSGWRCGAAKTKLIVFSKIIAS
jgi:hypothetical protein